jgi:hypothetical protein
MTQRVIGAHLGTVPVALVGALHRGEDGESRRLLWRLAQQRRCHRGEGPREQRHSFMCAHSGKRRGEERFRLMLTWRRDKELCTWALPEPWVWHGVVAGRNWGGGDGLRCTRGLGAATCTGRKWLVGQVGSWLGGPRAESKQRWAGTVVVGRAQQTVKSFP